MSLEIPFTKMVGTGNDFLVIDAVHQKLGAVKMQWPQVARLMCERRYGVGADGVLVLQPSRIADCKMRVFNPDGSEAEMCGNGARCVAGLVSGWNGRRRDAVVIETAGGLVSAEVLGHRVRMRMPDPRDLRLNLEVAVDQRRLQLGSVNTGVPHVVVPVGTLEHVEVERLGRQLRFHRAFQPRGTNVNFLAIDARRPNRLSIRTYERGVEAETLACGTGVAAAAVIYAARQHRGDRRTTRHLDVETRGGETLAVSLTIVPSGGGRTSPQVTDVILEGPIRIICRGTFSWSKPLIASQTRKAGKR